MQSPFPYEADLEIERTFHLRRRSKDIRNKGTKLEGPHQIWWGRWQTKKDP